jgi:nucleoid-associated protein YgaU
MVVTGAGCRGATRLAEVERVDLDLAGGNRGYLVGAPPESPGPKKTTRQIIETTVEVPTFHRMPRSSQPVGMESLAPPEPDLNEDWMPQETSVGEEMLRSNISVDTYLVKPGDSLWSIAAKPEIYGKATGWRRIFEANRDTLSSPDRVRPGMTLQIPRDEGERAGQDAPYTK